MIGRLTLSLAAVGALVTGAVAPAALATMPAAVSLPIVFESEVSGVQGMSMVAVSDADLAAAVDVDAGTLMVARPGSDTQTIPVGPEPYGVAVDAEGTTGWVTLLREGRIVRVDLETEGVARSESFGFDLDQLAVSPDGRRLLASDTQCLCVLEVDPDDLSLVRSWPVPLAVTSLAISRDGRYGYAASGVGTYVVIDLVGRSSEVVDTGAALPLIEVAPTETGVLTFGKVEAADGYDLSLSLWDREGRLVADEVIERAMPEVNRRAMVGVGLDYVYVFDIFGVVVGGEETDIVRVPIRGGMLGEPEAVADAGTLVVAIAVSPDARLLANLRLDDRLRVLDTGEQIVPTVDVRGRLAKKTLRLTGSTTNVPAGAKVGIFIKEGRRFQEQRKQATVRANGTYSWKARYRKESARVFVMVEGVRSRTIVVR